MENEKVELMYRRPGEEEHEVLTDVLDDILNRLNKIERLLNESPDEKPGLTE